MINPYDVFRKKGNVSYYRDCKNYLKKIPYFENCGYPPSFVEVFKVNWYGYISVSVMGTNLLNNILVPVYDGKFNFLSVDTISTYYTESGGSLSVDFKDKVGQWFCGYPFSFGTRLYYSDNSQDCFEFLFNTMLTNQSLLNPDSFNIARLTAVGDWYMDGAQYKRKIYYDFIPIQGVLLEEFRNCCQNLDYLPILKLLGGQ